MHSYAVIDKIHDYILALILYSVMFFFLTHLSGDFSVDPNDQMWKHIAQTEQKLNSICKCYFSMEELLRLSWKNIVIQIFCPVFYTKMV